MDENNKMEKTGVNIILDKVDSTQPKDEAIDKTDKASLRSLFNKWLRSFTVMVQHITVEPILLCYLLPISLSGIAVQSMDLEKACRVNLNYSSNLCEDIINLKTENITTEINTVQSLVAKILAWSHPTATAIPAIMILFVGAWSDRTNNRKICILLPLVGEIISKLGLIVGRYYFLELPLEFSAIMESVPPALTGGKPIMFMGLFAYISDITSIKERTFRIGVVTLAITLSLSVGTSVSGILTKKLGYYGVFSMSICLTLLGLIYTSLRIKVLKPTKDVTEPEIESGVAGFFSPKHMLMTLGVAFKNREGFKRARLLMAFVIYLFVYGPMTGEFPIFYMYTIKKFNFTPVDFSIFMTYNMLLGTLGTITAISIFSKMMQIDDSLIGIVSGFSRILACLIFALAPTWQWFYAAPLADIWGHVSMTCIRSIVTKIVGVDEVGKITSLMGVTEALVPAIFTPIYSSVYMATIATLPGAFYLVSGAFSVPTIILFIAIYITLRKEKSQTKNKSDKEQHAYDNQISMSNE